MPTPRTQPIELPSPQNAPPWTWDAFAIGALLLLTLPWWRALGCPLILVDDPYYVTRNPDVLAGLTPHTSLTAFTHTIGNFWIPLTSLSLKLDVTLFGPGPIGFHATNVALHIANALLLYFFLRLATGRPGRSLLVAALFAMHPLRVESVAWVTERKDVLSAFFGLLALLAYVAYAQRTAPGKKAWGWYCLVCLLFLLSLLAKPVLVTFPLLLLLVDIWPLHRIGKVPWPRLLLEKLPFALLALVESAITIFILAGDHLLIKNSTTPLASRLGNAAISYLFYLRDTFYFRDLTIFYPERSSYPLSLIAAGLLLILAVAAFALALSNRLPRYGLPLLIGWLWFLGTLVPNIGIIQSGLQSRADRFTYFASIGLLTALVWLWPDRWTTSSSGKLCAGLIATATVALLAFFTHMRLEIWRDPLALYQNAVAHTYQNGWMESFVAKALDEKGDAAAAEIWYRRSLEHMPDMFETHGNYGSLLGRQHRYAEALLQFDAAVQLAPDNESLRRAYELTAQKVAEERRPASQTAPAPP